MYYKRTMEETIKKLSGQFPCITVYGARQVGKSTMLQHLYSKKFASVTLDDVADRDFARSNPRQFLESYGWPLIIDEIQKAPDLLNEIKLIIDKEKEYCLETGKKLPLMYLLTGSSQFELRSAVAETLVGRTAVLEMGSMTLAERKSWVGHKFIPDIELFRRIEGEQKRRHLSRQELFAEIFRGGMPDVVNGLVQRENYFKSYVDNFLNKDIRSLISANSEGQFVAFMSYVAARTAQQLNIDDLTRNIGITSRTAKRWLTILECSGLIILLQPYLSNLSARIIKSPKLYFMDTGLCAYLCKWPTAETLEQGAMSGAFFETFVVTEVIKSYLHAGLDPKWNVYYFRDKDQHEVDLIISDEKGIWPVEIKKGLAQGRAGKNFAVMEKFGKQVMPGIVLATDNKIRPLEGGAWIVPVELM